MWKNWDETKVVAAQMWRPFESAALWVGNIINDPGKVIAYMFIALLLQVFPSLIANINATALKGAKIS